MSGLSLVPELLVTWLTTSEVFQTSSRSMCMSTASCGMQSSGCFERRPQLCVHWHSHWGWRDRLSTSQALRLPLRQLRVLRRRRDCTLALLLTTLTCTSTTAARSSEKEGLHSGPPPRNYGVYLGGGGTGPPPHNCGDYLAGGGTGPPTHNSGEYFVYCSASCKEDGPLRLVPSA